MNAQPDISAGDSHRLRELCRKSTLEIRAVGGVSAATSLETIGYIRKLETAAREHVAWCRYVYDESGGIQSIKTCSSNAKGAFKVYSRSPSDTEQLVVVLSEAERVELWRAIAESDITGDALRDLDIDDLVDLFVSFLERRTVAPSNTKEVKVLRDEALKGICVYCGHIEATPSLEADGQEREGHQ